ncbi:MAG: isocitrate lyase/PEP mutase family protein, partial [Pseudomonadota bacterium]
MPQRKSPAQCLRDLFDKSELLITPSCGDALSATLIEQAGFETAFISGFATAASRIGQPDTGLISYGEMVDTVANICAATSIPVLADGDTGYGNALNVKRTVKGYARAGAAAIMIEDQLAPKRCGHTRGKQVVGRDEALDRIKAAVDARDEGEDILILARTDARHTNGLNEALTRAAGFAEAGADILFVEAPHTVEEMAIICREVPGHHLANMLEGGHTPILSPAQLAEIGYAIAAYPLTLMSAAMKAMLEALSALKEGRQADNLLDFAEVRTRVGFENYYEQEQRYADR